MAQIVKGTLGVCLAGRQGGGVGAILTRWRSMIYAPFALSILHNISCVKKMGKRLALWPLHFAPDPARRWSYNFRL